MIGFVGLGNIGLAMAERLQAVAGPIMVWNRSTDRVIPLEKQGAIVGSSPEELFDACEIIGICVTSHIASGEIATRMFARAKPEQPRRTLIDLSTGSPTAAADLARQAARHGVGWVDAPVSGGPGAAAEGKLTLFMGGDVADIAASAPLLDALSARKTSVGSPGAGQAMKLCNQMIVASNIIAIAETIAAARHIGIDMSLMPEALFGGFADSPPLRILGPRMAAGDLAPKFGAIGLMEKDLLLARAMMSGAGARTPVLDLCTDLCALVEDRSSDIASLVELFEKMRRTRSEPSIESTLVPKEGEHL
jgi:3-hydroxyisobutyrate dehydrogenase-like beta-hydroxyacid dehydrogenase